MDEKWKAKAGLNYVEGCKKDTRVSDSSPVAGSVRLSCVGCRNLNNSPTAWWCDVQGKSCSKSGRPKQECRYGEESELNGKSASEATAFEVG